MAKSVEKPKLKSPGSPPKPPASPPKSSPSHGKKIITTPVGGGHGGKKGGGGGHGGGGHGNNQPPSPWLNPNNQPIPNSKASFVEYLRWMRPADHQYKDATKVQILQMAMENAKYYDDRLKICNKRTKAIAGEKNTFQVTCPWRIRVGGHRGPESILLPAFDALGMPYIPSATLRGVARTQAVREILSKNPDWQTLMAGDRQSKETEKKIKKMWDDAHNQLAPYFGSLEADKKDQAGKVVFLDAYPTSGQCLMMDMANNIWKWKAEIPEYESNPNSFLSLKEPTFLIGLRLIAGCSNQQLLDQVKKWLIAGLANGAGSQINTGYGQLLENPKQVTESFLKVDFSLEGQLIHGYQTAGRWNQEKKRFDNGINQTEARPTAFKSMLRYWFRVFALGVMPISDVQTWEGRLFGSIQPEQYQGYLRVNILDSKLVRPEARSTRDGKDDKSGLMKGTLSLSWSLEAPTQTDKLQQLLKVLTWLMFNLGGIGLGSRRPCHSRKGSASQRAPWWRGSSLYMESDPDPWNDPEDLSKVGFAKLFKQRLRQFYQALAEVTQLPINPQNLLSVGQTNRQNWVNVADTHCRIMVVSGESINNKPYALAMLHDPQFKVQTQRGLMYDQNLCGKTGNSCDPSPIWIFNIESEDDEDDFQIVTIFGATASPRSDYLHSLKEAIQVFPFK